jgi:uncharacterized protein (DUF952 family)
MGKEEFVAFNTTKAYAGSAIDLQDGFLHMSTADTLKETAARYYAGRTDLHFVKVDLENSDIRDHIKWDYAPSRGTDFPHLYDMPLPITAVVDSGAVPLGEDGKTFALPEGL